MFIKNFNFKIIVLILNRTINFFDTHHALIINNVMLQQKKRNYSDPFNEMFYLFYESLKLIKIMKITN